MHPQDYCIKWVPRLYGIHPEDRGFKARSITELARVTGLKEGSIKGWGADYEKHPAIVATLLSYVDFILEIEQTLEHSPLPPLDKNG